jgi:hypothetical protein
MGVAHYLSYGEQLVMGSWRLAERLIRCVSIGLALRRVRSAPHNIGDLTPCGDLGKKFKPLTSLFCHISAEGIFDRRVS